MQLYVSIAVIAAVVLWGLVAPAGLGAAANQALGVMTRNFGWLYLWVVLGLAHAR